MLASMSWAQFSAWQEYARLEPFGEDRADLRAGIISSTLANINRDTTKKPQPFSPEDFMPDFDGSRSKSQRAPLTEKSSWQNFKSQAREYAKAGVFTEKRRTGRRQLPATT